MLGYCKECNTKVGHFSLADGLCKSCLTEKFSTIYIGTYMLHIVKIKRVFESMPRLSLLLAVFILFQLISPWAFQYFSTAAPIIETLTHSPAVEQQLMFTVIVLMVLSFILILSFIIRFYIVRSRLNVIFTLIVLFILSAVPLGTIMLLTGDSMSFIDILFLTMSYHILRLENLSPTNNL